MKNLIEKKTIFETNDNQVFNTLDSAIYHMQQRAIKDIRIVLSKDREHQLSGAIIDRLSKLIIKEQKTIIESIEQYNHCSTLTNKGL